MSFQNAEDMLKSTNSQSAQDMFVLTTLGYKRNGYFLEIGTNHPVNINNSYVLEKNYGWNGLLIEYDGQWENLYKQYRKSPYVISDARNVDYAALFLKYNFPKTIDYLQIDLEVSNGSTIQTLQHLEKTVFSDYTFSTVTFEHDIYTGNFYNTRKLSREIFENHGYVRLFSDVRNQGCPYEDWYVHPSSVSSEFIQKVRTDNSLAYNDVIRRLI
jgi:hypothetical protein